MHLMSGRSKIIFQGVKFFWKTRTAFDVTIVDHELHNATEVILFDIAAAMESPSIYINSAILGSKLEHDDFEVQKNFAALNSVPITDKFIDGIVEKAKTDYIMKHLVIAEYSVEGNAFVFHFEFDAEGFDCICVQPETLVPHKSSHHQQLM